MRPESDITDYHTEFSGITQDQLVNVSILFLAFSKVRIIDWKTVIFFLSVLNNNTQFITVSIIAYYLNIYACR